MADAMSGAVGSGSMDMEDSESNQMLVFTDGGHNKGVLSSLNLLQKGGQFCDVKLVVGKHEISAHRAVLAAASSYLFKLFATTKETAQVPYMFELTDLDYKSFQYLLNYIYSGRLEVPRAEVMTVYTAAMQLRIASAAKACSDFLVANLSPTNCLEIRSIAVDAPMKSIIDQYIQNNIVEITNDSKISALPRILVEIIGIDEVTLGNKLDSHLYHLVFNWAKNIFSQDSRALVHLVEQINVLYLDNDQNLQDCRDLNDSSYDEDDVVNDYKKLTKKKHLIHIKTTCDSNSCSPNQLRKFGSGDCEWIQNEKEWSLLASYKTAERTSMGVTLLKGTLAVVTLHIRPVQPHSPTSTGSESESVSSTPSTNGGQTSSIERHVSLTLLSQMSTARCGFGLAVLNKKLYAVGGYDRGECLRSAEAFDIENNVWTTVAPMKVARGRVAVAVLNNKLYAIGGSDGHTELRSVECFDPETNKWTFVAEMLQQRSCPGAVSLNNRLYCIGGSAGQCCIAECEVYDPNTNTWTNIAPLNAGHFQAAVCVYNDKIFAIGGSASWNCLNSVEVYDPIINKWQVYSSLNTPRRGAGADIINGKIMVIGGNDGTQSLRSTEIYDTDNDCWYLGPQLGIERANVSVASYGNKLFAVGGFSGKRFLDSLEYFEATTEEWCCYAPVDDIWHGSGSSNGNCNELSEPRKKIGKKSRGKGFSSASSNGQTNGTTSNGNVVQTKMDTSSEVS